jgi:hypothetical protein
LIISVYVCFCCKSTADTKEKDKLEKDSTDDVRDDQMED